MLGLLAFAGAVTAHGAFPLLLDSSGRSPFVHTNPVQFEGASNGIHLQFNATHEENVLSLEHAQGLRDVTCEENQMVLKFDQANHAELFASHKQIAQGTAVLVGGPDLGCGGSVLRQLDGSPSKLSLEKEPTVVLRTRTAHLGHIFRHLNATARVTAGSGRAIGCGSECSSCVNNKGGTGCIQSCSDCATDCIKCIANNGGVACADKCQQTVCPSDCATCVKNGGGTGCSCSQCGNDCNTCISGGGGMACAELCAGHMPPTQCNLGLVLVGKCTDQWSKQIPLGKPLTFDYSGKPLVPSTFGANVVCQQCQMSLTTDLVFEVAIQDNKLDSVGVSAKSSLQSILQVDAKWDGSIDKSVKQQVASLKAPPIVFFIGAFPVSIQLTAPVTVGAHVSGSDSASISAGAKVTGDLNVGLEYDSSLQPVGSFSVNSSALPVDFSATSQGDASAFIELDFGVVAEHVLTASIPFIANVEGKAQTSGKNVDASVELSSQASASGTLALTLGGKAIGPKINLPEKQIFTFNKEIWHS